MENIKTSQIHGPLASGRLQKKHRSSTPVAAPEPLKAQRGFVLISTLTLLPLFLILIFGIGVTLWMIDKKEKLQWTCENHTLQAQQILIDGAYDLIQLNPQVENLIHRKRLLELEMRLAVGPERLAIAAQLLIVRGQMSILRTQQKNLMINTQAIARLKLLKLKRDIKDLVQTISPEWLANPLLSQILISEPKMQVEPRFKDLLLPTYHFVVDYSQRQRLDVDIKIWGHSPFPSWFKRATKIASFQWRDHCSTQPRKQGGLSWRSYLTKDKHL